MMKRSLTAAAAAIVLAVMPVSFGHAGALVRFDVAEDHTRFRFAETPVHESGMPAHGNPFVTQGYIYPAGTLEGNIDGVLEDGSPAFPELVLGTWTCDGWFVGEGGDATTGVWLVSRQVMHFHDDGDVVITQGTELADAGVTNARPITGATGDYAPFQGVMLQTLIGFNAHMGVNATFEIPVTDSSGYYNEIED